MGDGEDSLREKLNSYGFFKKLFSVCWLNTYRLKCVAGKWHLRGEGGEDGGVGIIFMDMTGSHGTEWDSQWEMTG